MQFFSFYKNNTGNIFLVQIFCLILYRQTNICDMKCIILARVSTETQSLDSQVERLMEEARRHGYDNDNITVISGKESGVKLDIEERQTIQEMKSYVDTGQYDMVFIWEVSRLARRPKVLYEVREWLIERHVNLRCLTPSFTMLKEDGTIDPTASIVFALFGTMAEEEARLSKQRMMRGRIAKREQGKFIGGNILFGYKIDEDTKKIVVNEKERDIVIEIFERYIQNESVRSIGKDLIDRGQLRYDEYTTAYVMLRRMIRRSEYAGIKQDTYDYPAIISQDLYYKVRERAESKRKYKTRVSEVYYLRGLLRWKPAGLLMSPTKCAVQYRAWDEKTNTGTMINMDYIDSLVWHFIKLYKERASGPEREKMMKDIFDSWQKNIQRIQTAIEEHQNIEATIERINERIVKGKMNDEQGDRLIDEQKSKLRELDRIMNKYTEDNRHYEQEMKNLAEYKPNNYTEITPEQKQELFRQCVRRVDVIGDGIKSTGKYIYIYMVDGTKHSIHMTKRGNYFNTYVMLNGEEHEIQIEIIKRFVRKIY